MYRIALNEKAMARLRTIAGATLRNEGPLLMTEGLAAGRRIPGLISIEVDKATLNRIKQNQKFGDTFSDALGRMHR